MWKCTLGASIWVVSTIICADTCLGQTASPPEGFALLFNGADLTGWSGKAGDPPAVAAMSAEARAAAQEKADELMRAHWTVQDGALSYDGGGDSLCTSEEFRNFELYVDWMIQKDGDSGIYLRGTPQVQIWDNPVGSGGLYNNQQHIATPLALMDRPVGEWNTFRIRLIGDAVTVYLNDVPVVIDTPLENYWDRNAPFPARGQIELQSHGTPLKFRNLFIRRLPDQVTAGVAASAPIVKPGDLVALVGDSITEQRMYSRYIEEYLLACSGVDQVQVMQFGWGGETAEGFVRRMANDLLPMRPDVVTTCYGMNDGSYRPYEPAIGQKYGKWMREMVETLEKSGARVVVGSPGAVDTVTFHAFGQQASIYNDNLSHLRDISQSLALEFGMPFANVHDQMIVTMHNAQAKLGSSYHVCGGDGVHPAANGHLAMAYSFLKGMGFANGREIARIVVDMNGQPQAAGAGQHVVGGAPGKASLESAVWPFCFAKGDQKSPESMRSILPYLRFNEDLNRYMLVVVNLEMPKAKVRWGALEKTFTREDLERGINLAAEFPDNPFSGAFDNLDAAIARKQAFETSMVKSCITQFRNFRDLLGDDAQAQIAFDALRNELLDRWDAQRRSAMSVIVPIRHEIEVIGIPTW